MMLPSAAKSIAQLTVSPPLRGTVSPVLRAATASATPASERGALAGGGPLAAVAAAAAGGLFARAAVRGARGVPSGAKAVRGAASVSSVARAAEPYKFCSIHPYFTILDEAAAAPIMAEFVEKTKAEKGCIWYGWDRAGEKLFCNEAYVDADAVLAHLENVGGCIDKILAGPAKLESIEFHGPAAEMEKLKPTAEQLGATCYAVDSGFTSMAVENGPSASPGTLCTIHPYFTILDEEAAKPLMAEFVEKTRSEKDCVYYGWTKVGDKLFCREGYGSGDGILAHLDNVGPLLDKMLAAPLKLESIAFHGPAAEMEKIKETASGLGAAVLVKDSGFERFEKA